jgi:hypothetical protein
MHRKEQGDTRNVLRERQEKPGPPWLDSFAAAPIMEVVSDLDDGRRNAARPAVFTCVRVRVPHNGKEEEEREIADEAAKPKRPCTGRYSFIFFLVFPGRVSTDERGRAMASHVPGFSSP